MFVINQKIIMKKLELNYSQLKQTIHDIMVIKSCPAIPFKISVQIHGFLFPVQKQFDEVKSKIEVIQSQVNEFNNKNSNAAEQQVYSSKAEIEFKELISKNRIVNIDQPVKADSIKNITIDGEKEIEMTDLSVKKFSYRDSFFNLIQLGFIEQPIFD
jgi:hypothetical protein